MALLYSSCLEARIFAAWPSAKDAPITFVICSKIGIIRIFPSRIPGQKDARSRIRNTA
jgi:hypothetical protein